MPSCVCVHLLVHEQAHMYFEEDVVCLPSPVDANLS